MLLDVLHRTELSYQSEIWESVMELRLAPPSNAHQSLRGFGLAVGPPAQLFEHVDWLGNRVHQFSVLDLHRRIEVVSHAAVETHPSPVDLARPGDRPPFEGLDFSIRDYLEFSGSIVRDVRLRALAERLSLGHAQRACDAVLHVTRGLRDVFAYRKSVTKATSTVADALSAGGGVCQDFAHLAIALLRSLGIPTRYVSGYLFRPEPRELETHAWCEAHLPSVGWVGFDPTHGELVGEGHIVLAVGRSFLDVPPNRGTFKGQAAESIAVSVEITPLGSVPHALLTPRPTPIPTLPRTGRAGGEGRTLPDPSQQTPLLRMLPRQQQSQQQQAGE